MHYPLIKQWRAVCLILLSGFFISSDVSAVIEIESLAAPDALPVQQKMPDPLISFDGFRISTPEQWASRREEMKKIIEYYAIGHAPPAPENVVGDTLFSMRSSDDAVECRHVRLTFGPGNALSLDLAVLIPKTKDGKPEAVPTIVFPTFSPLFQNGDSQATLAKLIDEHALPLSRGYAIASFDYQQCGADKADYKNTGFFPAYLDYDWGTLRAWAWAMSRCVDYLETCPEFDSSQFIDLGHSRLGKTALIAGAFDERFSVVAPAGSGCGGTGAYRFNGEGRGGKEGLEDATSHFPQWFHPRLSEFSGQVEKLPFDQHWLMALVAPRLFIASDGMDDPFCNSNALVESYRATEPVYELLGAPDRLKVDFRSGGHRLDREDWLSLLNFCDQNLNNIRSAPIKIALVGDSTMCEYDLEKPDRGWGMLFQDIFEPGTVDIHNLAKAGRSTKTFLEENRWQPTLALEPEYVFIQFGHNDSHAPDRPESTDAETDYRDYLRRYVDDARKVGATPVLVTPMVRRTFHEDGTLDDNLAPYASAMKAVAVEKAVTLFDLHAMSWAFFEPLGSVVAQEYARNPNDPTHFNEKGAREIVDLVKQGIVNSNLALKTSLKTKKLSIHTCGAMGDCKTINTESIQSAIDQLANSGGGTVVVPEGVFVSGALFFQPGVNLHLEAGAVLQCSTDLSHFPEQRTRIEGHFEDAFNPALINADGCDGFTISGPGVLDGAGRPIWDSFWRNLKNDPQFKNLDQPRARLCLIENSHNVFITGITFKDSQFWNLHLYNCQNVLVEHCQFAVPDDYKQAPSTDAIDVDSCQDVTIRSCLFSVTDDCLALKGTKGPFALQDTQSKPVERIEVRDCYFKRGHSILTCGSEATVVSGVTLKDCKVGNDVHGLLTLKLRPDTPQQYENINIFDIEIESERLSLFRINKWSQYHDPQGQPEPVSRVNDIQVSDIRGSIGSLGKITGNTNTEWGTICLKTVDVQALDPQLEVSDEIDSLVLERVLVNGEVYPRIVK